jgi:hypothetical protein
MRTSPDSPGDAATAGNPPAIASAQKTTTTQPLNRCRMTALIEGSRAAILARRGEDRVNASPRQRSASPARRTRLAGSPPAVVN